MRIHLATDHAGLEFSRQLVGHLEGAGHEVVDHGPTDYDPLDDYPAFIIRAAQAVVRDQDAGVEVLGIVFGGSGNGEAIAANKVHGVRAALCGDATTAAGARKWNDANVLALSLRTTSEAELTEILDAWFAGRPSPDDDDRANIEHVAEIEGSA